MKIIYRIIVVILFTSFNSVKAQNIDDLMQNVTNLSILESTTLYRTETYYLSKHVPNNCESIKLELQDSIWLSKIKTLLRSNPLLIQPYLKDENTSLASYILLLYSYNMKIPLGVERVAINVLHKVVKTGEDLDFFKARYPAPNGENQLSHIIAKDWKRVSQPASDKLLKLLQ